MSLSSIRFQSCQYELKDWSLIKVTGTDRLAFFQGQVTNDLLALQNHQGQITARLNRTGKLQSFFFVLKNDDCLYLLSQKILRENILTDFNKFIIMDDVVLESVELPVWVQFNNFENDPSSFETLFFGLNAKISFAKNSHLELASSEEVENIRKKNGWPLWGVDVDESMFINDSYLNEIAISYKKGCFLGQETVAKIENNRGAAYYPVLLKLDKKEDLSSYLKKDFIIDGRKGGTFNYQIEDYIQATLFRDYRVVGKELNIDVDAKSFSAIVVDLPLYKAQTKTEIALDLYHHGVDAFQNNETESAKQYMKRALEFNPALADAYESLGVMLGREERHQEAIDWMDKLLSVNPHSVMAHTNKSLYLMKMGKIEEAEAEKSLATVKSFAMFGEEAKLKKQLAEEQKKKEEDMLRREKMFLQVLEIDEEDAIALYGMADIFYYRKEFSNVIKNLNLVVKVNPKYSTAYVLLGKAYEALNEIAEAKRIYQEGISVASKQGDMMPANEMQSRLNQLVVSSSLS